MEGMNFQDAQKYWDVFFDSEIEENEYFSTYDERLKQTPKEDSERHLYEIEFVKNDWSLSDLKRQYDSSFYERLALSRNKDKVYRLCWKGRQ